MELARVVGNVVLNHCPSDVGGKTLLVLDGVHPVTGECLKNRYVAFDTIGAGDGQLVLVEFGPEAGLAFEPHKTGSDATIVAIVDEITIG